MSEPSCGHSGQPECPGCGQCPDCCVTLEGTCPTDEQILAAARGSDLESDSIDISDGATINRSDYGAQVLAWIWVEYSEVRANANQYDITGG